MNREQILDERERDLRRREDALRNGPKAPNFPKFKPIVYYNVQEEIPAGCQNLIEKSYKLLMIITLFYFLNMLAGLVILISGGNNVGGFLLSILYFVVFPPLTFYFNHFQLYKSLKTDSSARYLVYFINSGIAIVVYVFLLVGISLGGGSGLVVMFKMFNENHLVAGIFCAVFSVTVGLGILAYVALLKLVFSNYRAGGHSIEKARNEAVVAGAKNPHVRKAAFEAAKSSV